MEINHKQELAFLYLHGELSELLKPTVFEFILNDVEFRQCLKEEVKLREQLSQLHHALPKEDYFRMLADLRKKVKSESVLSRKAHAGDKYPVWLPISEKLLSLTTPPLVYPIIKILQRRCLT